MSRPSLRQRKGQQGVHQAIHGFAASPVVGQVDGQERGRLTRFLTAPAGATAAEGRLSLPAIGRAVFGADRSAR
jgi:hypothetical protein